MTETNSIWKRTFSLLSLVLLGSILFGYFISSLAFGIWTSFSIIWILKTKSFKLKKAVLPFVIFGLFSFLSIIWSIDKDQTLHGISRQLPLLLFGLVALFLPRLTVDQIKSIVNKFIFFICGLSLVLITLALIRYNKYEYLGFLFYHELVMPLDLNAIYVSYLVSFCFLYLFIDNPKVNVALKLSQLIILGVFLVMLSSKMILFVTTALALLIVLINVKHQFLKIIILGIFGIVIAAVCLTNNPVKKRVTSEFNTSYIEIINKEKFQKGRIYTGLEARLLQIRVFNEIMSTPFHYIMGLGLDASKKEITKTHQRINTPERFHTYNFHNQYLQIWSELGFIGLVLFILILGQACIQSLKYKFFLPFVVISIFLFLTESVIWRQRGILFFGMLYVLLFITKQNESEERH